MDVKAEAALRKLDKVYQMLKDLKGRNILETKKGVDMSKVEHLHLDNRQISTLCDFIVESVLDRAEAQNMTYIEVIGALNRSVYVINKKLDDVSENNGS